MQESKNAECTSRAFCSPALLLSCSPGEADLPIRSPAPALPTPLLTVTSLAKSFGAERVFDDVTFSLAERETLAVLGRSGSGKTTLLKCIAGLEDADGGTVSLDGAPLDGLPPEQRGVVYLYQEALLFPHLDVRGNVGFGLRLQKTPSAEIDARVDELLHSLELADQGHKRPTQLSGGQKQRVAFGRALAVRPRLLLLDEPFGALDTETRGAMQRLFTRVSAEHEITSVFVTHDLKEAILMGDRLGTMRPTDGVGRLVVYDSPAAFAADPASGVADEAAFWRGVAPG